MSFLSPQLLSRDVILISPGTESLIPFLYPQVLSCDIILVSPGTEL